MLRNSRERGTARAFANVLRKSHEIESLNTMRIRYKGLVLITLGRLRRHG